MPSISLPTAIVAAAGISAGGALLGGITSANGAKQAANTQQARYMQTRADLQPYNQGGQGDFSAYNAMGPFSFNPTMGQLEETPGYQFSLTQGLKSVESGATARGLGVSGAALKGGAAYASGLAANTYQQQFQNALAGYQTNANKLLQGAQLGENAGAQTGSIGATLAGNQGQFQAGAGGALGGALQGAASSLAYPFFQQGFSSPFGAASGGGPGVGFGSGTGQISFDPGAANYFPG